MCGIIGIVGKEEVADRLVDGLRRMEYRGYDSAGVCTVDDGQLIRRRAPGKLIHLVEELKGNPAPGRTGIAHTRWATHGAPTAANAHPHATQVLALVHNGIIENFRSLREELTAQGRVFESETDTEVVAHLISAKVEGGLSPVDAVKASLPQLRGAFALAIAFRQFPDMLIGARLGSPLVVGYGEGETYLGSDALALAPLTQRICYLEEGDWVIITRMARRSSTRTTTLSTAPSWPAAPARRRSRRAISAITCRRRSTSSPPWLPRRCAPMSVSWTRASRCPRSISTCRPSAA
jgi:glucosamine--fructose-6-phosphate aminotransferase (isomerizing)